MVPNAGAGGLVSSAGSYEESSKLPRHHCLLEGGVFLGAGLNCHSEKAPWLILRNAVIYWPTT